MFFSDTASTSSYYVDVTNSNFCHIEPQIFSIVHVSYSDSVFFSNNVFHGLNNSTWLEVTHSAPITGTYNDVMLYPTIEVSGITFSNDQLSGAPIVKVYPSNGLSCNQTVFYKSGPVVTVSNITATNNSYLELIEADCASVEIASAYFESNTFSQSQLIKVSLFESFVFSVDCQFLFLF